MPGFVVGSPLSFVGDAVLGAVEAPQASSGMRVATGSFRVPASAATDTVISTLDFQPKVAIAWSSQGTIVGKVNANAVFAVGFGTATGSNNKAMAVLSEDALNPGNAVSSQDDDDLILGINSGGGALTGELSAIASNGFTIDWGSVSSGVLWHWLALGGGGITNAATLEWVTNTVTGNQAVTGIGFEPDFLLHITINSTSPLDSDVTEGDIGIGVVDGTTSALLVWASGDNVSPTLASQYFRNDRMIGALTPGDVSREFEMSFVSFDSDGFTGNLVTAPPSARTVYTLAIQGGQYQVGSMAYPTTAVRKSVDGLPFAPKGGLFFSCARTLSTTARSNQGRIGFGAAASPFEQGGMAMDDDDAVAPTVAKRIFSTSACVHDIVDGALVTKASLAEFGASSFTLDFSLVPGTAHDLVYVLFGGGDVVSFNPTGTVTSSGAIAKQVNLGRGGTLTSSGAIAKRVSKGLAGTLTSSGALTVGVFREIVLAGTLALAGSITKQVNKGLAGALTPIGSLTAGRLLSRALSGTVGLSGTLTALIVFPGAFLSTTYAWAAGAARGAMGIAVGPASGPRAVVDATIRIAGNAWGALTGPRGRSGGPKPPGGRAERR
ncbi:MAG: hypothetical protein ACKVT1_01245 [Dehalococcoidia bacterium]